MAENGRSAAEGIVVGMAVVGTAVADTVAEIAAVGIAAGIAD